MGGNDKFDVIVYVHYLCIDIFTLHLRDFDCMSMHSAFMRVFAQLFSIIGMDFGIGIGVIGIGIVL